ncbi:54S ribosomal protein L4 mitochondrial [Coniothyrium glycines]
MASIQRARLLRPAPTSSRSDAVLAFLTPAIQCTRNTPRACFSTSPARCKKDNNARRGLSVIRGTGLRPRQTLSVKQKDFDNQQLPTPAKIDENVVTGTPDHGLWDFFKNGQLLQTPVEEHKHGRSWTMGELRSRDWGTLHQLWWICVKERNRLATEKIERRRLDAGYGDFENAARDKVVQETMKAIADTLAERHQAYAEALELAKNDPSIDLSRTDGPQYQQTLYDPFEDADDVPVDSAPAQSTQTPATQKAAPV